VRLSLFRRQFLVSTRNFGDGPHQWLPRVFCLNPIRYQHLNKRLFDASSNGDHPETGMTYGIQTSHTSRFLIANVCSSILLLSNASSFAQFDESAELPRGLVASYSAGDVSVERLEELISHDWGSSMPDRRLGQVDGAFQALWKSQFLVRQEGSHQIHAFVHGKVRVEIGGTVVLDTESQTPGWVSGDEFTPDVGFQSLAVQFEKSADEARLQLFWSSETFPLEPLSGHLFFREAGRPDLAKIELGRNQFEAFRCGACHKDVVPESKPLSAPDLTRSVAGLSTEWIVKKLTGHVSGKMPQFNLSAEQATAIAAALASTAEKPKLDSLAKPGKGRNDDNDRKAGLTLVNSLGCLACHTTKQSTESDSSETESEALLFGGGSLADIGSKRPVEWFNTWLRKPETLNRSHRMPAFDLSSQERRQLALALASLQIDKKAKTRPNKNQSQDQLVESGTQLIRWLSCQNCHKINLKPETRFVRSLTAPPLVRVKNEYRWFRSCTNLESKANPNLLDEIQDLRQPKFNFLNYGALRAFIRSLPYTDKGSNHPIDGQRLLVSRNCTACHPRGLRQGLAATAGEIASTDAALRGQAPALVPPNLNALGDRLLDEALAKAVSGEQKRRMDWKLVRMPKFKHSEADRKALTEYFINSDRIPDNAPTWDIKNDDSKIDDQTLLIGQELVGPKGFSCIACHQVGDYVPKKAAMGTRGSDLVGLGNRMRHSYFVRWTRSPLRIVPGVEMPSYSKAVHGVLGDDADAQLEALWKSLADPRFEPPTDPSSVEQYFIVENGTPARVIRDVFTNPESNGGGHIPRAFAVGFENGHSVIVDLENLSLRRWTFGDFARQRTIGKSWYWDMAGSDVVTGFNANSNYSLVKSNVENGAVLDSRIYPRKDNGTVGELLDYQPVNKGVRFRFRLEFEIDGKTKSVIVEETLASFKHPSPSHSAWRRRVAVSALPDGYELVFSSSTKETVVGSPATTDARGEIKADLGGGTSKSAGAPSLNLRLTNDKGRAAFAVRYQATLKRPLLAVTLKPLPPAKAHKITSMPGFAGVQLPVSTKIMPTAMTVLDDGTLAFTSLEGHVYLAKDTDGDGVEDKLTMFEEGLSAPYGIIQDGDSLLVSHKPEILRLRDTDGDGRADERTVFSSGWGFNDNYHDWTCGIARDAKGNLYVGIGSDYAQLKRPKEVSRWRGKVLQISPDGTPRPFAHAFRYPTGIAIDAKGNVFATDNQGVQNTFNELNHLRDGFHFGVPKNHEQSLKVVAHPPAIQIPHDWTRSVNGITFLSESYPQKGIAGHGVGCEFNGKHLIRFTHHEVDGILQGATYFLSTPNFPDADANFLGPLSITTAPNGDIYIGSIHDSGWLGGQNTGSIVKLKPSGKMPNGIKEIQATADGFEIRFQKPVDKTAAENTESYSLSGYTREWKGGYATPDSGRFQPKVEAATLSADGTSVRLKTSELKTGFVYEINCLIKNDAAPLWPATGHYTLHRIPGGSSQ
jgi:glucose/arabinose dehydrogenase/mono/diheme cytochrome c family protein